MNGDESIRDIYQKIQELEIALTKVTVSTDKHEQYTKLALDKADEILKSKLVELNNVREQLADQAAKFVTSDEYLSAHKIIEIKIETMQKIVWGGLAVVSFLVFAVPIVLRVLYDK